MWILDFRPTNGDVITRREYANFGQLAFDDEVHRIVESLTTNGYLEWREAVPPSETEEPVPTYKLFRTIQRKGCVEGTTKGRVIKLVYKLMLTNTQKYASREEQILSQLFK